MVGGRYLDGESATKVEPHSSRGGWLEAELPQRFSSKGKLMLGSAESGMENQSIPHPGLPRPGRPGNQSRRTAGGSSRLNPELMSELRGEMSRPSQ